MKTFKKYFEERTELNFSDYILEEGHDFIKGTA